MREFFRGPMWASAEARQTWEPAIAESSSLWRTLEAESVRHGLRDSARLDVRLGDLPELSAWCAEAGVRLVVLGEQTVGDGYTAGTARRGWAGVRAAITRAREADWVKAWAKSDSVAIGDMLGYPACCVGFFVDVWERRGLRDTTLAQADGGGTPDAARSVLLRWLGVRPVAHLPCSFDCGATADRAASFARLAVKLGLPRELTSLSALQAMPATYSSSHGIGAVETPAFRFEFSTDVLAAKRTIVKPRAGEAPSPSYEPSSHADNGFASHEAMSMAHALVLWAGEGITGRVLDLGCGDGALLAKMAVRNGLTGAVGVESDRAKVNRGVRRHGALVRFLHKAIADALPDDARGFDATLVMPGRFVEDPGSRGRLPSGRLLLYAYGDRGPLAKLCEAAGLPTPKAILKNRHAEAGVAEW